MTESTSQRYGTFPLTLAAEGEKVQIVFVRGGSKREERLMSMGLKVNDIITVQLSRPGGGKVVLAGESRFAIDSAMAQRIFIAKAQ